MNHLGSIQDLGLPLTLGQRQKLYIHSPTCPMAWYLIKYKLCHFQMYVFIQLSITHNKLPVNVWQLYSFLFEFSWWRTCLLLISSNNLDIKHPTGVSITKVCFYSTTNHTLQATCKRFAVAEFPFQVQELQECLHVAFCVWLITWWNIQLWSKHQWGWFISRSVISYEK
jgi:hypothetical protein